MKIAASHSNETQSILQSGGLAQGHNRNRRVLVTGASSGIGLAVARLLAEKDWIVYVASRSIESQLEELFPETSLRSKVHPVTLDIHEEVSCLKAIHRVTEDGPLDALIHCAGAGIAGAIEEIPLDQAFWQYDNLTFGTIRLVHAALPVMRKQGYGHFVLISSVAAAIPVPFQTYYSSAKAAVNAYAYGLADEIRPLGIHVTVMAPGDTRTGFTDARRTSPSHPESPYRERLVRSVARMAHDEQHGVNPEVIARQILRQIKRRHPALLVTPGIGYKTLTLLSRLLPLSLVRGLVRLLYA